MAIFHIASENGPFIVDVPIKDVDFPVCYVGLPEGIDGIDHALVSFKIFQGQKIDRTISSRAGLMTPPGGILPIKLSLFHKHRNWICWFMGFYNQETIHQKLKNCDFVLF